MKDVCTTVEETVCDIQRSFFVSHAARIKATWPPPMNGPIPNRDCHAGADAAHNDQLHSEQLNTALLLLSNEASIN